MEKIEKFIIIILCWQFFVKMEHFCVKKCYIFSLVCQRWSCAISSTFSKPIKLQIRNCVSWSEFTIQPFLSLAFILRLYIVVDTYPMNWLRALGVFFEFISVEHGHKLLYASSFTTVHYTDLWVDIERKKRNRGLRTFNGIWQFYFPSLFLFAFELFEAVKLKGISFYKRRLTSGYFVYF